MKKLVLFTALAALVALATTSAQAGSLPFGLDKGEAELNIIDATTLYTDVSGTMTPRRPQGGTATDFPGYALDGVAVGDESRSVVQIREIFYPGGGAPDLDINDNVLTGLVYDVAVKTFDVTTIPGTVLIHFTGGQINVYYDPNPGDDANGGDVFDPLGNGLAALEWDDTGAVDTLPNVNEDGEMLWLSADLLTKADGYTQSTFLQPAFGDGGSLGLSYLEITGGAAAHLFERGVGTIPNTVTPYDLTMQFTLLNPANAQYASTAAARGGWQLSSADPIRGTIIPEPATIALLGFGLVGLGAYRRKRR